MHAYACTAFNGGSVDILDSGASHHMTPIRQRFTTLGQSDTHIQIATDSRIMAEGAGPAIFPNGVGGHYLVSHCLYVPQLTNTLQSCKAIKSQYGAVIVDSDTHMCLKDQKSMLIVQAEWHSIPIVPSKPVTDAHAMVAITVDQLHTRFLHSDTSNITKALADGHL